MVTKRTGKKITHTFKDQYGNQVGSNTFTIYDGKDAIAGKMITWLPISSINDSAVITTDEQIPTFSSSAASSVKGNKNYTIYRYIFKPELDEGVSVLSVNLSLPGIPADSKGIPLNTSISYRELTAINSPNGLSYEINLVVIGGGTISNVLDLINNSLDSDVSLRLELIYQE